MSSTPDSYFHFQGSKLHYSRWGQGPQVLLAFHGFGQHKEYYQPLAQALQHSHTLYVFDLFYHGLSFWHNHQEPLQKAHWQALLQAFLQQEGIERFSVAGYSLGGKFALATVHAFAPRIDHLLLIAADGIKTQFWYSLATYPGVLQRYFKSMVPRPAGFFALLRFMQRLGVVDRGLARFASTQMNTRKKRSRVYYSWTTFRLLQFSMPQVAAQIQLHGLQVHVFVGRYDKIITAQGMQRLLKHLPASSYHLEVLPTGHNNLIEHTAQWLGAHPVKW